MKQNVFEQLSKKQMRPMENQEPESGDSSKIGYALNVNFNRKFMMIIKKYDFQNDATKLSNGHFSHAATALKSISIYGIKYSTTI